MVAAGYGQVLCCVVATVILTLKRNTSLTVIKDAGLLAFGERWAAEGRYASIIFDYRFFGGSGGTPRNFVSLPSNERITKPFFAGHDSNPLQPDRFINNGERLERSHRLPAGARRSRAGRRHGSFANVGW
ncbi:hypothetical protein FB45DRAFT_1032536 [Roridomyces roridus]|uniref:Uncharacterized protein n=1 Tax=Roridomyces roridus TaxID=1738132 RepID=A0AAD7BHI3_9AGAR|nr:hypothetical protein FB45DRAFT_1032536 [Roridomyces roridus]